MSRATCIGRAAAAVISRSFRALLACCLLVAVTAPRANPDALSDDAVKAAYLHRFAAYVQWPSEPPAGAPFVIAVAGADSVAAELEKRLPGVMLQNHRAQVRRVQSPAELQGVQILYVGPGGVPRAPQLVRSAMSQPILLVTEDEGGLSGGGIINFTHAENTVRFEVSLTAAERRGLKISAGLLSVAARVEGPPQARREAP